MDRQIFVGSNQGEKNEQFVPKHGRATGYSRIASFARRTSSNVTALGVESVKV